MVPEQLEGHDADTRTDIFVFGAVVYEMLTGKKAFEGKSQASLIAAILERDPPSMTSVQPLAPPGLDRLVRTCLAKDPEQRWQNAGDLVRELQWISEGDDVTGRADVAQQPQARRKSIARTVAAMTIAVVAGAIAASLAIQSRGRTFFQPRAELTKSLLSVAPADRLAEPLAAAGSSVGAAYRAPNGHLSRIALALSPDGRTLVFGATRNDRQQLYARVLDHLEATPIGGTENAVSPFFSPDGRWIGFWADGALKKVAVTGGVPTTLCDAVTVVGATWTSDNTIFFAHDKGGLWQVTATGGSPVAVTTLDDKQGEVSHRLPELLPDNEHVMFMVTRISMPAWDDTQVVVQSLITGEKKVLVDGGGDARYLSAGYLAYVRQGALMVAPFDPAQQIIGSSTVIVADLMQSANMPNSYLDSGTGQFAVSRAGLFAYLQGGMYSLPDRAPVWVDRSGAVEPLTMPARPYIFPRLSPDGSRVSLATQGDRNVWIHDLSLGTTNRVTTEGRSMTPIWTPDGKRLTYRSAVTGRDNLYEKAADSSGAAERLTTSGLTQSPGSWSPGGDVLAFVQAQAESLDTNLSAAKSANYNDIWMLPADRKPVPLVQTRFDESDPDFSPDGRWLAYASRETGRLEVYVQPFPGPGPRVLVSKEGGTAPTWRRDGKELFYVVPPVSGSTRMSMMAVPISGGTTLALGQARLLFDGDFSVSANVRGYDVTPDGSRFLMIQETPSPPVTLTHIVLVQNWFEELKRLVPTQ